VVEVVEREAAVRVAPALRCHRCGAVLNEVRTLLDSRRGVSIQVARCRCGEQNWTEEA
jgi:hypothetical protein